MDPAAEPAEHRCEAHGRHVVKRVCAHLAPGDRGTLVGVWNRSATVLVCAACAETWTEDGAVDPRFEREFVGLVRAWCPVCWASRAPARLCRGGS